MNSVLQMQLQNEHHRRLGLPQKPLLGPLDTAEGKRKQAPDGGPRESKRLKLSAVDTPPKPKPGGESEEVGRPPGVASTSSALVKANTTSVPKAPVKEKAKQSAQPIPGADVVFNLPAADLRMYLQHIPDISISPPALTDLVLRNAIRGVFNAACNTWLDFIPASSNPPGSRPRNLWFLQTKVHLASPVSPGEHGFVFGWEDLVADVTQNGPWSVFRKVGSRKWLYLGEYENEYVGDMSKEQFCGQKETVNPAPYHFFLTMLIYPCRRRNIGFSHGWSLR